MARGEELSSRCGAAEKAAATLRATVVELEQRAIEAHEALSEA